MNNKFFTLRRVNMVFIVIVAISVMITLFANNPYAIAQYSFSFSIPRGQQPILRPSDIAIDKDGNIYITQVINNINYVVKLDRTGKTVMIFGSKGRDDGQFFFAAGIALDSTGHIYVTDSSNHRVQIFDANGNFISKFGSPGNGDGQFNVPLGIELDSADNIYVTDSGNDRVGFVK